MTKVTLNILPALSFKETIAGVINPKIISGTIYPIKSPITLLIVLITIIADSLEILPTKIPIIIPKISLKTKELKKLFFFISPPMKFKNIKYNFLYHFTML